MIWPTTDRIPHSLIFKRMQIKRIADNIRAFSFLLTNWNKKPYEERVYRWTDFFYKLDNKKWKCARAHVQENKSIYLTRYCPTCEKLGSTIHFFVVGFFVPIWHVVLSFFLEKYMRPTIQICNDELYSWFWEWGKYPTKQPIRELYGVTELVGQMPWHL